MTRDNRSHLWAFAPLVLGGLLISCASAPGYLGPNSLPTDRTHDIHHYHGFRVRPPRDPGWRVRIDEQTPERAVYRREFDSPTHALRAEVGLTPLETAVSSHDGFMEAARPLPIEDAEGFQFSDYAEERLVLYGQWALRYTARLRAPNPARAGGSGLILRQEGCVVLHPSLPGRAVHILLAERGLEEELDPQLKRTADRFMNGVVLDSGPPIGPE